MLSVSYQGVQCLTCFYYEFKVVKMKRILPSLLNHLCSEVINKEDVHPPFSAVTLVYGIHLHLKGNTSDLCKGLK